MRGGSQHEEKLLLTSGGRATVHSVSDCQKYYCSTIIIVRLPEEAKSQAQGHPLTIGAIEVPDSLTHYLSNYLHFLA